MKGRLRILGWTMLVVWTSWITVVQAVAVGKTPLGPFTPDLSLLCVFACAVHLHKRDVVPATLVVALARIAFSVDPPLAILSGYLAAALFVRSVRRTADLERPAFALTLVALLELAFSTWLLAVHAVRQGLSVPGRLSDSAAGLAVATVATAVCAVFAGALVHLPGLKPLRTRRW